MTQEVYNDLQSILQFVFNTCLGNLWLLINSSILVFILVAWVIAYIIKFFKRFI